MERQSIYEYAKKQYISIIRPIFGITAAVPGGLHQPGRVALFGKRLAADWVLLGVQIREGRGHFAPFCQMQMLCTTL